MVCFSISASAVLGLELSRAINLTMLEFQVLSNRLQIKIIILKCSLSPSSFCLVPLLAMQCLASVTSIYIYIHTKIKPNTGVRGNTKFSIHLITEGLLHSPNSWLTSRECKSLSGKVK